MNQMELCDILSRPVCGSMQYSSSGVIHHLAPKMMATSACSSARERAALQLPGALSGTTPRPMAVARKGSRAAARKLRSAASACEYAAPFPITTSGLHACSPTVHLACPFTVGGEHLCYNCTPLATCVENHLSRVIWGAAMHAESGSQRASLLVHLSLFASFMHTQLLHLLQQLIVLHSIGVQRICCTFALAVRG